jgi:hypothetical protein
VTLDFEKEQAVQALCAHYAQDHLSTGELETRFERVYKSASRSQLDTVLAGLPALKRADVAPAPLYRVATGTGALPSNKKRYLAVFSGVKKEGAWEPAPEIEAKVIFGELVLDLRDAIIPLDGMQVDLDVMFGEARVLLPPGVGAEVDASAIMGSVEDKAQRALPGAPVIRVRGGVLFGTIRVETRLPKPARMESWRQQIRAFLRDGTGL